MITKKKILILPVVLTAFVVGVSIFQSGVSLAATTKTRPIKVIGMAKFVLNGTVMAVSVNTLTLHILNTSKNAKLFDNKDKTLTVGSKTAVTKNGKNISLSQIKVGSKVRVFGVFDKRTGNTTLVRWVKVVEK